MSVKMNWMKGAKSTAVRFHYDKYFGSRGCDLPNTTVVLNDQDSPFVGFGSGFLL